MKKLAVSDLAKIVGYEGGSCVSLYVPQTAGDSPPLAAARDLALARASRYFPESTANLQAELATAADDASRTTARAIFVAPGFAGYFDSPRIVSSLVVVADSFHIVPLIPNLQRHGSHYVADLSRPVTIFYEADDWRFQRMTGVSETELVRGRPIVAFGQLEAQIELHRRCQDRNPIVGGFETITPVKNEVELAFRARAILRPFLKRETQRAVDRYLAAQEKGFGIDRPFAIARAAAAADVELLLIEEGANLWGRLDRQHGEILEFARSQDEGPIDDLLDDLSELTILGGGEVRIIPARHMPTATPVAAVLRKQRRHLRLGKVIEVATEAQAANESPQSSS